MYAPKTVSLLPEGLQPLLAPEAARATPPGMVTCADGESANVLAMRIRAHLPRAKLCVTVTDNRHTMISVRRRRDRDMPYYEVRMHRIFSEADGSIMRALARYIAGNCRDASRALGRFIDARSPGGRSRQMASVPLVWQGEVYDLKSMYDALNEEYFGGRVEAHITWGPRLLRPRRRRSIKMGSYTLEERMIRIHRSLDRVEVPKFFVESVVHHEMLHQLHDAKISGGRKQFHTRAFRADEAKFREFQRAREWERAHLDLLLTC